MINSTWVEYELIGGLTWKKFFNNCLNDWLRDIKELLRIRIVRIAITIIVALICLVLVCKVRSCISKITDKTKTVIKTTDKIESVINPETGKKEKPKVTVSGKVKKSETQPIIGWGKGTEPAVELTFDSLKIKVSGEDARIELPKNLKDTIGMNYIRPPIIQINPQLFGGAMIGTLPDSGGIGWGIYIKLRPLKIKNIGVGGFFGEYGNFKFNYGLTVGYEWRRLSGDLLLDFRNQKLWLGVSYSPKF